MAQYAFKDQPIAQDEPAQPVLRLFQQFVRGMGLLVMIVGLSISLAVMVEAWSLYRDPVGIERLARAIERGSHMDHALSRASQASAATAPDETTPKAAAGKSTEDTDNVLGFRLSYFVAWVIAILLLLLIGRLAISAMLAGGQLVLYDRHVEQLARAIVRESRRNG